MREFRIAETGETTRDETPGPWRVYGTDGESERLRQVGEAMAATLRAAVTQARKEQAVREA